MRVHMCVLCVHAHVCMYVCVHNCFIVFVLYLCAHVMFSRIETYCMVWHKKLHGCLKQRMM